MEKKWSLLFGKVHFYQILSKDNIVFFYIILIFKKHEFSFYFHLAGFSDLQFKVQCFQDIGHQDCIWSCICLKQEFCSKGVVFIQLNVYNYIHIIILYNLRALYQGRWKVHDYFLLLHCKSSILFTEKHIFKIILYFFNTAKCAANNSI